MKKTKLQLQEQRAELVAQNVTLLQNAKNETRSMSDSEQKQAVDNTAEISEIDTLIEAADKELRNETEQVNDETKLKMKNTKEFSLIRAIRNRVENRPQEASEVEMIDAGKSEMRHCGVAPEGDIVLPTEQRADILAGTDTAGAEVVAEDKSSILAPLRASLIAVKAGATFLTGLVGDLSMPAYAGTSAAWKGEVAAAADGGGAFSEINFSPLRLTAYVDISKRFLIQDSASAEAMLKQDIVNAVAGKLESTLFSKTAASAGVSPAGLFPIGDTLGAGLPTWGEIVGLETAVDTANALQGNLSYITNAAGRGLLKTTVKHATNPAGFMMSESGEMNGYPVHVSNHVAADLATATDEDGLAFANWSDLIIAQWAGIDIVVDPFTLATTGQIRLVVNAYFDAKFRRTASLAHMSINFED